MNNKIERLIIQPTQTLNQALKKMDQVGYKLLIVTNADKFVGLVTIGSIQRAIIANLSLETPIKDIIGDEFIVFNTNSDREQVKQEMMRLRLAFMPLINEQNEVADVIFWEDVISTAEMEEEKSLELPVVLMAGGFGTRLRPLTYVLPKPLLPYGEKTILENIIERFGKYKCTDFYVSVNYKADLIEFYFDRIKDKKYSTTFFTEDQPLGTAGSLHLLAEKLDSTFFVSNCDILIDEDYAKIHEYHVEHDNELTIVASLKHYEIPYGILESGAEGELLGLKEKPNLDYLINCGMYILEPHLLNEIPKNEFFHITDLIEKIKARGGKVGVFPVSENSWIDIGEWQHYSKILLPQTK